MRRLAHFGNADRSASAGWFGHHPASRTFLLLLLAALVLAACSHRRTWTTHDVTIVTQPPGAACSFERDGVQTRSDKVTPMKVTFTSIGPDIDIRCSVFGYTPAATTISSNRNRTIHLRLSPVRQASNNQ